MSSSEWGQTLQTLLFVLGVFASAVLLQDVAGLQQVAATAEDRSAERVDIVELARLDIDIEDTTVQMAALGERPLGVAKITASSLNHRTCGSLDCTVITSSPRGTVKTYYEERDGWIRITPASADIQLWASQDYVEEIAPDRPMTRFAEYVRGVVFPA